MESTISKTVNRNAREIEQKPVNESKSQECPQRSVTYIRWGNSTCEYGATTLYPGVAAGGHHSHQGSPANILCLPEDPQYYSRYSSGS